MSNVSNSKLRLSAAIMFFTLSETYFIFKRQTLMTKSMNNAVLSQIIFFAFLWLFQ